MYALGMRHAAALQGTRIVTGENTLNNASHRLLAVGDGDGHGGIGLLVHMDMVHLIVRVVRISDRLIVCELCGSQRRSRLVSGYAPQAGRPDSEVTEF